MKPSAKPAANPRLAGRVAVISGGAQGIGRAIAQRFQCDGARVVLLDCDTCAGEKTARALSENRGSPPIIFIPTDLLQPDEIRRAMARVAKECKALDVLVNNAGIEIEKPLPQVTLQDWELIMGVNLRGALLLTQAALPLFPKRGGAIVNIGSIHATHAFPDSIPYACSKAGLVALTRNLALELAPRHIRVNVICPGYIDTRLWDEYLRRSGDGEGIAAQVQALHPLGRRGLPADVAEAAAFLAADSSSFVTGTHLVVDGGLTIRAHP
jgi:NAD(P)-dependent dehydrogenase (short-subunit alcohol dehydrogenase family)